ncbi:MAG: ATP-binding protein [Clostridiales bacterium]|nr:ATP-binding protein [Clostridiales bacterium]
MENTERKIYQNTIDNLSDGVIVIGYDSRISTCNDSACAMLGLGFGTAIGKSIAELMLEIEENNEFFELLLNAVYEKKKISRTVSFRTKDSLKFLKVTTTLLVEDGIDTALIAVISDQTETTNLIIRNQSLATQIKALMNSFVEVMVTAIEEKSSYNANHTRNMVRYATRYLEWLSSHGELTGKTSENTGPLIMSFWLHDIGKLLIPQDIMDKPSRLDDMLLPIRHKIEISRLMLKNRLLAGEETEEHVNAELARLDEAEELIVTSDTLPFLDEERIAKLKEAAGIELLTSDGKTCPLLDAAELKEITVARGTLTDDERAIMQSHVVLTGKLLSKMEFVGEYKKVPEWASEHHEHLDGSGYPNGLAGEEIPWETRLLTIVDIFDALTADDRPYKPPMPPEDAFVIIKEMAEQGKLDKDIVESFYASNAWNRSPETSSMKETTMDAKKSNLDNALAFIHEYLEEFGCLDKTLMQLDLAVEEIFVNIAQYSYGSKSGPVTIRISHSEDHSQVTITFTDSGLPYDPLAREDPDVTLPVEERQIGGLGIFLIKKYMDDVRYRFADGKNNLTIVKNLEE